MRSSYCSIAMLGCPGTTTITNFAKPSYLCIAEKVCENFFAIIILQSLTQDKRWHDKIFANESRWRNFSPSKNFQRKFLTENFYAYGIVYYTHLSLTLPLSVAVVDLRSFVHESQF